ncbi:RluA family pseudouridine synthase [Bermanella marisrubri]|uniref:Pseudouridine synthase n=1 Tax=Bermanella marisrubri TaxID=207949 RepID=Q1N0M5_9GAMM|nr:RluA family pseudouridine synthase [Bermanella marisrubri]EAT11808.1 23S rRNA pseudouridylate 746 synthase [Oceanobacter sp. RED65] [Bermanella marisrubri]QIZ83842.1 RluA family pseudouridine synthase [Bermanella marisrubri]
MHILYEDKHLLVIDKPSGLLSQQGSLDDSVPHRLLKDYAYVGLVHRLDQATSGVMMMALNKKAHGHLAKQFQDRKTFKVYQARVFGSLPGERGQIDLPLRCDWPNRPKQEVHIEGKSSLTHWQCIERSQHWSRVALIPHTGRSHQLRVHMAAMGYPILGDRFYAHHEAKSMAKRLNLHAASLAVNHPISGKRMRFFSSVPF